ncbi:7-cyano-7-deazaguanine synthase [Acidithiobacillus montserratensis]|uniref:7-cyano-7-deazaguanine synthase n=1 Tax=Acidithiobacillus montserratensis TaxID=2729135 RepID=A0ACD5HIY8_9PROT|nr:7-cyano-7-deazaguanine synthase [Acidithiobacillus montserratensis]MBU2747096.1 7-cyano-7-deazaguanine synthase QueC [Acidithiobacillus montserratensis]
MLSLAPMNTRSESTPIIRQPEPLSPDSRCLLLMSGGVESSTLLFQLARQEHPQPVFLDYAQRAARQEWQAVQTLSAELRILPQRYDLSAFGNAVGALRTARYHVPLPHRNFVAIAAVAAIASNMNIKRIVIGLSADDAAVDACSRPAFQSAIRDTLGSLGLQLETPLIHLGKDAIIQYGNDLGVPWAKTYSCLLGRTPACGFCPQCLKRRAAFARAGVNDSDMGYDG